METNRTGFLWMLCKTPRVITILLLMGQSVNAGVRDENHNMTRPLYAPSLAIGNLFRPTGHISAPSYAPAGTMIVQTSISWVNTWNVEPDRFMIDGEWIQIAARISRMMTEKVEVGLYLPFIARTGGIADSSIERFHKAFGLGNARREEFPRNQCRIYIRGADDQQARWEGDELGMSDLSLFSVWDVTHGDHNLPGLGVGCAVTLPTGDEDRLLGSGSATFGASACLSKRIGTSPWLLFIGGAASYSGNKEIAGIALRPCQFAGLCGIEYEWSQRVSFIIQNLTTSPIAKDYYEFSDPVHELNLGVRLRGRQGGYAEISFQENLLKYNNSADVGIHVSVRRKF